MLNSRPLCRRPSGSSDRLRPQAICGTIAPVTNARVAELVDALASGASELNTRGGSSPLSRTKLRVQALAWAFSLVLDSMA